MQNVRNILILLLCFIKSVSAEQNYNFKQFSIDMGLCQSNVTCLTQSKYGYIIVGTNGGGIDYFDGKHFHNIGVLQGLSTGQIESLYVNENDVIICGLRNQFYSVILPDTIINYNNTDKYGASSIVAITRNKYGRIFLCSEEGDIFTLDDNYNAIHQFSINKHVNTMIYDKENTLWIAVDDGLYSFEENQKLKKEEFLEQIEVHTVYLEENNTIWAVTYAGIAIKKYETWEWCNYINNSEQYSSVLPVSNKEVWFGTRGKGLFKWDGSQLHVFNKATGFTNFFVNNMLTDNSGVLWIGTLRKGLFKCSGEQFTCYTKRENSFIGEIVSINQDTDENYWFGSLEEGVLQLDKDGNKKLYNKKALLNTDIIYYVAPLSDKRVLIASGETGLLEIKPNHNKITEFKLPDKQKIPNATLVKEDSKNRVWVATSDNGIFVLKNNQYFHFLDNIPSKKITTFTLSDYENIWIGTEDNGCFAIPLRQIDSLFKYNIKTEKIKLNIKTISQLNHSLISAVYVDNEKNVWIGTLGNGLMKISNDNTIHIINKNEGLLSDNICSITATDNVIWIGTDKGVNKLLIQNKNNTSIIETFSGIECNVNASYIDNNKNIWFGNANGAVVFNANQLPTVNASHKNRLHFTYITPSANSQKSNIPIVTDTAIVLPYVNNRVSLQFKAVDVNNPEDIEYQYQLEGLDSMWHTVRNIGEVHYSFIPSGNYLFRARVKSNYRKIADNEIILYIKVLPPFWQTYWFYLIIFILLAVVLVLFFRQRQLFLIQNNKNLQELVAEKVGELKMETMWTDVQENAIKEQAKKLAERNKELKKLSLVASNTDNSVIVMNNAGEVEWINDGFCRMYNILEEDVQYIYNQNIADIHKSQASLEKIQKAYHEKKTQIFVFKITTNAQREKWIQTVLTPVLNYTGECEQFIAVETDITRIKQTEEELSLHIKKSDSLLLNILPEEIAEELKSKGEATPQYYKSVSVLFADVKDFSSFCMNIHPQQLLKNLHEYFNEFDEIVQNNFVEKIKTIGDAYMCAGGLPLPNRSHAFNVVLTGLQMQNIIKKINEKKIIANETTWEFRIGIHTGGVISGVVGKQKFAYDIWGDTVNIAARMETFGKEGRVNVSSTTYLIIKNYFDCTCRGKVEIKNRGKIDAYYVNRIKSEYSTDNEGIIPNEVFRKYLNSL